MKTLEQIHHTPFEKVSDKWSLYLREYDRVFSPLRESSVSLLEIGIQNGGSLERWSTYFSRGTHFVGCDINPDCERLTYEDSRISLVVGDVNQAATIAKILSYSPRFDIVIDDGSHASGDIIRTFAHLFSHISNGGVFIAEDLHCSYWKSFDGGLFHPNSSMAFFKRLADVINHEHWGLGFARVELLQDFCDKYALSLSEELLASVHSVEFINSICVIRKDKPEMNLLGSRQVSGMRELVVSGVRALHGTKNWTPDEKNSLVTETPGSVGWETNYFLARLDALNREIDGLTHQLVVANGSIDLQSRAQLLLNQEFAAMHNSISWRVTAPLRWVGDFLRSLFQ
jgi:hypothetical protein